MNSQVSIGEGYPEDLVSYFSLTSCGALGKLPNTADLDFAR